MKNIIEKNRQKIQSIIKKFTGRFDEDIEQEIYIKTYKNLDKYKEQNKFCQWICAIAANICRDYLKSAAFKKENLTSFCKEAMIGAGSKYEPEKIYSSLERQKIILKEVYSLPLKYKKVIILYEFEDLSYDEISKKLNIPQGTVKSRINYARKILKEKLQFLLGEEKI